MCDHTGESSWPKDNSIQLQFLSKSKKNIVNSYVKDIGRFRGKIAFFKMDRTLMVKKTDIQNKGHIK